MLARCETVPPHLRTILHLMVRTPDGVTEVEAEHLGALCALADFDERPDVDRVSVKLYDVVRAVHVHFQVFF